MADTILTPGGLLVEAVGSGDTQLDPGGLFFADIATSTGSAGASFGIFATRRRYWGDL